MKAQKIRGQRARERKKTRNRRGIKAERNEMREDAREGRKERGKQNDAEGLKTRITLCADKDESFR